MDFAGIFAPLKKHHNGVRMAETIDDISIDWTDEDGIQKVRELKKEVLTRGT